jgi:Animal haem peroxidase
MQAAERMMGAHGGGQSVRQTGVSARAGGAPAPGHGFRNLLPPRPGERFGERTGLVDDRGLPIEAYRDAMVRFAAAAHGFWDDPEHHQTLEFPLPHLESWENPRIPAGYTYLLQLIAHDLVDSDVGGGPILRDGRRPSNLRRGRLRLETLYGGGPESSPSLYWRNGTNDIPRVKLALGPMRFKGDPPAGCRHADGSVETPYRDFARHAAPAMPGVCPMSADARVLTETAVADPRNDDSPMLSQLAVLFHLAHNAIADRAAAICPEHPLSEVARAEWTFETSRRALTRIYRAIIREDVLRRILHPEVYAACVLGSVRLTEPSPDALPVEFSHGAFRFAHAMVRNRYQFNHLPGHNSVFRLDQALMQTSIRKPAAMPLDENWVVDWSRFFPLGANNAGAPERPLHSRRLLFPYTGHLLMNMAFDDPSGLERPGGLLLLDLLSHAGSGSLSVTPLLHGLAAAARERGAADLAALLTRQIGRGVTSADLPEGHLRLRRGLQTFRFETQGDTPLPVYAILEAAQHEGEHLGPLGSVIVAETILGVLDADPDGDECPLADVLSEPLRDADWQAHPGASKPLPRPRQSGGEIVTMAQFVRLVARIREPDGIPF